MSIIQVLIEPRQQIDEERKRFSDAALKAMIVPLVAEQLLQMVVGLADTMMVRARPWWRAWAWTR